MNAIIDFGNTRSKWAVFEGTSLLALGELPSDIEAIKGIFNNYSIAQIMVSKVGNDALGLMAILSEEYRVWELNYETPLPITNSYKTPQTLGMDRLAAIVGAWALFPKQASLVIDLGTCITYDFITTAGVYMGGGISPGMYMRARAMHEFTAKLPMINTFEQTAPLIGQTTQECLTSGVVHGLTFEISGHIEAYQQHFEIFNTVLCGGDAPFFETRLKAPIFARTELVMTGLNAILNHLLTL